MFLGIFEQHIPRAASGFSRDWQVDGGRVCMAYRIGGRFISTTVEKENMRLEKVRCRTSYGQDEVQAIQREDVDLSKDQ